MIEVAAEASSEVESLVSGDVNDAHRNGILHRFGRSIKSLFKGSAKENEEQSEDIPMQPINWISQAPPLSTHLFPNHLVIDLPPPLSKVRRSQRLV